MISEVSETSEKFGRMDTLVPIFDVMQRRFDNDHSQNAKISLATISLFDGLLAWPIVRDDSFLKNYITNAKARLETHLTIGGKR